jgi:hypothetical protein
MSWNGSLPVILSLFQHDLSGLKDILLYHHRRQTWLSKCLFFSPDPNSEWIGLCAYIVA